MSKLGRSSSLLLSDSPRNEMRVPKEIKSEEQLSLLPHHTLHFADRQHFFTTNEVKSDADISKDLSLPLSCFGEYWG